MDSLGTLNHAISTVGYWIFESNYEQAIFMTRELLDLICPPSVTEEQIVKFGTLFFFLLDTCGNQVILKQDKYEYIGNMTTQKIKNIQEWITKLNLHIDIW